MYFLCGCVDLVKTAVSVSSSSEISFGLLFGAVNGCEEIHVSEWGLQPVWWGVCGGSHKARARFQIEELSWSQLCHFLLSVPHPLHLLSLCFAVTPQQRWQTGLCSCVFFQFAAHYTGWSCCWAFRVLLHSWGTGILISCLLLARCWCYMAGPSVSGDVGIFTPGFGKSESAVTTCTSLCAVWDPVNLFRSCLSSCMRPRH